MEPVRVYLVGYVLKEGVTVIAGRWNENKTFFTAGPLKVYHRSAIAETKEEAIALARELLDEEIEAQEEPLRRLKAFRLALSTLPNL